MPKLRGSTETQVFPDVIERLLESQEPSIRWKTRVAILGESPGSTEVRELQEEIRTSPRVRTMLQRVP